MGGKRGGAFALLLAAAMSVSTSASAHEDHDALGAGPGPAANSAGETQKKDGADAGDGHMGMGSMSTVDMNMAGRDIAGDDMDMGGMHEETANKNKSFGERLVSWLGRLHTMVIHFPIALFIGAFYLTDRNPILMTHRWLGTLIAVFGVALAWMAARHRKGPERSRTLYWVLLGLMTLAISIQGFLGGTFMHGGINHLAF